MIPGQKLKRRKRLRTHGFLKKMRSTSGRLVLKRRRQKGRKKISVTARKSAH